MNVEGVFRIMSVSRRKNFFISMLNCKSGIESARNVDAGKIYLKVQSFVESGIYDYYRKADIVAKLSLAGYDVAYISSTLGCSDSATRTHINEMSMELYDIFGDNFLQALMVYPKEKGVVDTAMTNMSTFTSTIKNFIPTEYCVPLENLIADVDSVSFDLKDCSREIGFLVRFSRGAFERGLVTLDPNKVRFLVDCINRKTGTSSDRVAVVKAIMGKETV